MFNWLKGPPKPGASTTTTAATAANVNVDENNTAPPTTTAAIPLDPTEPGFKTAHGCNALVTGSSGLCGARLVEMLLDRGAKTVICFDITEPDQILYDRFAKAQQSSNNNNNNGKGKIIFKCGKVAGDITSDQAVEMAFKAVDKIDVVFHIAALVGPFHDKNMYHQVNYLGTLRIVQMCKKFKVRKLVFSSSPSTRFTGKDVKGLREDQLPMPTKWLEKYAETKAYGERAAMQANDPPNLYTIAVAPHQVYGPHDNLFLPNLLETCGNGRLRIFGSGRSIISVCYVDNYAHGLMCGADALYDNSPALANFYIVTDDHPVNFWEMVNSAGVSMGFVDLYTKFHLPVWLLYVCAYIANGIGYVIGRKLKLNPFNVTMLTIHRYFSIENAKRDLKYKPVHTYKEAWPLTIEWFKNNWLPKFKKQQGGNGKKRD